MKKLFAILFLLMPFVVDAQTQPPIVQGSKLYEFKNGVRADSALFLPRKDTGTADVTMLAAGMLVYRPLDSLLYYRKGNAMTPLIGASAIISLNGLTAAVQTFATGTAGTNFAINSSGDVHTFNLPNASATARGVVTTAFQTFAGSKVFGNNIVLQNVPARATAAPLFYVPNSDVVNTRTAAQVLSDIGGAPASGSGNYIQNQSIVPQVANFHMSAAGYTQTNFTVYKAGSASLDGFIRMTTDVPGTRGAVLQLTEGADPGLATWIHDGTTGFVERMRITAAGNLGLGVTPTSKLHVAGNGLFQSADNTITCRSLTSGDATLSLDVSGVSSSSFKTFRTGGRTGIINNANEAISILTNGNVGIGTTTPQGLLHINTANTLGLYVQNTGAISTSSGAFVRMYNSGTPSGTDQRLGGILWGANTAGTDFRAGGQIDAWSGAAWTDNVSHPTYMTFRTAASGSTAVAERMRITAAGGVGIGTTVPEFDGLHLMKTASTITTENTNAYTAISGGLLAAVNTGTPSATNQRLGLLGFGSSPVGAAPLRLASAVEAFSEGAWTDNVAHPSDLRFYTTNLGTGSATEKVRITENGDAGIGVTVPATRLHVGGALTVDGFIDINGLANITGLGSASFTSLAVSGVTTLSGGLNANTISTPSLITTGEFRAPIRTTAISTTLTATDHTLRATASGITLTLPAANTCNGRIYVIINYNTGGTVTTSAFLNFSAVSTTTVANQSSVMIQSDGTNWYLIK